MAGGRASSRCACLIREVETVASEGWCVVALHLIKAWNTKIMGMGHVSYQ
jgi:hypothetical protein